MRKVLRQRVLLLAVAVVLSFSAMSLVLCCINGFTTIDLFHDGLN